MNDLTALAARLPHPTRIALFLDVDGTLIGPTHDDREAGVTAARRGLLGRIQAAAGGAVAVLTGRSIETVDAMFAPLELAVAGLQGADRRFPDGRRVVPVLTAEERRIFETVAEDVGRLFPQVEVEFKPAGMALVCDPRDPAAGQVLALAVDRAEGPFKVMPGRVAIDIVPRDADKGRALALYMEDATYAGRVPVHIGDDVPDEPAFAAAQRLGGFGVAVGTVAAGGAFRLTDHGDTWNLLETWLSAA